VSTFIIEFKPELPKIKRKTASLSLGGLDFQRILTVHTQEYDVTYRIDHRLFCYYPASILTVINDLHQEWELARSRTSHLMTLSGHPVLEVEFDGETALFLDPVQLLGFRVRKPIGEPISSSAVEATFEAAFQHVLSVAKRERP